MYFLEIPLLNAVGFNEENTHALLGVYSKVTSSQLDLDNLYFLDSI